MADKTIAVGAIIKGAGGEVQVMLTKSNYLVRTKAGRTERMRNIPRSRPPSGPVSPLTAAKGYHHNLTKNKQ